MKISGPKQAQAASSSKGARAPSAMGVFSLGGMSEATEAAGAARATGVTGVSSLDALLALQSVEDPMQRRRRAVSRAGRILDALDGLKVALLDGELNPGSLQALMHAVREERAAADDDERLQGILNEIETRAAVELAKLGRSAVA